jgi:hypothetical protein
MSSKRGRSAAGGGPVQSGEGAAAGNGAAGGTNETSPTKKVRQHQAFASQKTQRPHPSFASPQFNFGVGKMKSAGSPTPNKLSGKAKEEEINVGIHMAGSNVAMVTVIGVTYALQRFLRGEEALNINGTLLYTALKQDYWYTRENWMKTATGASTMALNNQYDDHAVALPAFIAQNVSETKGVLATFPPQEVWDVDNPHLMDEWNARALAFRAQMEQHTNDLPSNVNWISGHRVTVTVYQVADDVFASCVWMRIFIIDKKAGELPPSATARELAAEQQQQTTTQQQLHEQQQASATAPNLGPQTQSASSSSSSSASSSSSS